MKKKIFLLTSFLLIALIGTAWAGVTLYYKGEGGKLIDSQLYPVTPSGAPSASGNIVSIDYTDGTDPFIVYGGRSISETVDHNAVYFFSGRIIGDIVGGYAEGTGLAASGNSVLIDGAGARVNYWVRGGYSASGGDSIGNIVTLRMGTVDQYVVGGTVFTTGAIRDNRVVMSGGTVQALFGGRDSWKADEISGNEVTLSGGKVREDAYGGYSSGEADASNNAVTISGGEVRNVYGGNASGRETINAAENDVDIAGGRVSGNIYGGYSDLGKATGNIVRIRSGSISGNVVGGFSDSTKAVLTANATGNAVLLTGKPAFNESSSVIRGGDDNDATSSWMREFADNTLDVSNYTGSAINKLENFQYLRFTLPTSLRSGETILKVTDTAALHCDDGTDSRVLGIYLGDNEQISSGDTITLIGAGTLTGDLNGSSVDCVDEKGRATSWALTVDKNELKATLSSIHTPVLTVTPPAFDPVAYGYDQPAAKSIRIRNNGDNPATNVSVSVSPAGLFTIGGAGDTIPAGGSIETWTVRPNAGLPMKTHNAEIVVHYSDNDVSSAVVSFTVKEGPTPGPTPGPSGGGTGCDAGVSGLFGALLLCGALAFKRPQKRG